MPAGILGRLGPGHVVVLPEGDDQQLLAILLAYQQRFSIELVDLVKELRVRLARRLGEGRRWAGVDSTLRN